jgi:hypothetical protein
MLYASILLMCQLWSDAVRYLRRANEIIPAVHLAIALGYSGVLDGCHGAGNSTAARVTNSIPEVRNVHYPLHFSVL